jgi:hypothetical protein
MPEKERAKMIRERKKVAAARAESETESTTRKKSRKKTSKKK